MRGVAIDPAARTAQVAAGARWSDVIPGAAAHGLACLPGSSSGVGVVGYTMGGGFGWLGRRYGFAAGSVRAAEVVTADGEARAGRRRTKPRPLLGARGRRRQLRHRDALEFALHPVANVYAGNLFYPVERARDVLAFWTEWTRTLPDAMTSAVAFRRFPPLPTVPEAFRGRIFAALRGCWCGPDLEEGARLVAAVRAALGDPRSTPGRSSPPPVDTVSMDPVDPIGAHQHPELLPDLSATIDSLVDLGNDAPPSCWSCGTSGGRSSGPSRGAEPVGAQRRADSA